MAGPSSLALPLCAALCLIALAPAAAAHEQSTAGKYSIEVGWQYEPAVADQPNAITIRVRDTSVGDGAPVTEGVSLVPVLALGSDSKTLATESSDDDPGLYSAAVVPTKAGDYTVHITGTINGVQVDHTTDLESVHAPSDEAFPVSHGTVREVQDAQMLLWIASGVAVLLALVAIVVAVAALRRRPSAPVAAPSAPRAAGVTTPQQPAAARRPSPPARP
jgi:hypothetical protein